MNYYRYRRVTGEVYREIIRDSDAKWNAYVTREKLASGWLLYYARDTATSREFIESAMTEFQAEIPSAQHAG